MEDWVIVSACPVGETMRRYITPGCHLVACDAGWRNLQRLGLRPDLVVGDFDSAPPPPEGDTVVLPHVKDDTDTQYAARLAVERGADRVTILGALGGARLEHTLANLSTGLWLQKRGVKVLLADEHSEIRFLLPGSALTLEREDWQYFSLFPLEGTAEGVCVQGAFYPLQDATLHPDFPLGVSNEWMAEGGPVTIRLAHGALAVICTRAD